jgi:hypothetical protein
MVIEDVDLSYLKLYVIGFVVRARIVSARLKLRGRTKYREREFYTPSNKNLNEIIKRVVLDLANLLQYVCVISFTLTPPY